MDRDDEEIRILGRDVLEQLHLSDLRADVCGSAHGDGIGRREGDSVGVDGDDRGVMVSEGEEGASRYHCPFDVGLAVSV